MGRGERESGLREREIVKGKRRENIFSFVSLSQISPSPQIPHQLKRKFEGMSTSSLLSPLPPPCPLPPSKRPNRGPSPTESQKKEGEVEGEGGGRRGKGGGGREGRGEGGGGGGGGEGGWPEWGEKLLGGRGDPGGEFEMIQSLSNAKNTHNCYLSADLKMNKNKNRYKDVLPYEHTRVRLGGEGERGERGERGRGGDYINASLVKGVLGHRYIATQAPLPITIGDFCQMIWEQEIYVIVMLTRIIEAKKPKAYQYWPCKVGGVDICGDFALKLVSEKVHDCGYVCVRRLQIGKGRGGKPREVIHLHYTEWPDYGLPCSTAAIRTLVHITEALQRDQIRGTSNKGQREGSLRSPVLVHCSAGIGRAGTFIAIHQAIKQIQAKIDDLQTKKSLLSSSSSSSPSPSSSSSSSPPSPSEEKEKGEGSTEGGEEKEKGVNVLSIKEIVLSMREQRRGMVQTKDQYCFIYRVAEDALFDLLESSNPDSDSSKVNWTNEGKAVALFLESCKLDEVVEQPQSHSPQISSMEDYQNKVGMKFASAVQQQQQQQQSDAILPLLEEEEEDDDDEEIEYEEINEDEDDFF